MSTGVPAERTPHVSEGHQVPRRLARPHWPTAPQGLPHRRRGRGLRASPEDRGKKRQAPATLADHAGAIAAAQGNPPRNSHKWALAKLLGEVYGQLTPDHLTEVEVRQFAALVLAKSGTAQARYYRLAAIRSILRDLGASRLVAAVPRLAAPRPRNIVWSSAEVERLLAVAPPHQRALALLCHHAALRSGTALRVAPRHYDPERRRLRVVTKAASPLGVPTTAALDAVFAFVGRSKPDQPVVDQLRVKPLTPAGYRDEFRALCRQIGVSGKTLHDLRRTTAVEVMAATKDIRVVQHLLGHRHLDTTLWYLDHDGQTLDHATLAAALRLGEPK